MASDEEIRAAVKEVDRVLEERIPTVTREAMEEIVTLRERCANWRRLAEAMEALATAWKEEPKDPSLMEDWRSETLRPAQADVEERLSALREGGEEC